MTIIAFNGDGSGIASNPGFVKFVFEHRYGQFLVKSLFGKIVKRVGIPDELLPEEIPYLSRVMRAYTTQQCPISYSDVGLVAHNFKTLWLRMLVKDVNETLERCLSEDPI